MKKITVLVNKENKIVAARVPSGSDSKYADGEPPMTRFAPSEGEEVLDLDLPDEDVPSEPGPDFLETLQRFRARGSSGAKD